MSPDSSVAVTQLRQLIFYHIDNDLLDTANFLAGRLVASDPKSAENAHLLALTALRLQRFTAAYDAASRAAASGKHLGCAYVYAHACLKLGRNTDGIAALEKSKTLWANKSHWGKHTDTSRRHQPDAPAVYTLLAKLWQAHGDTRKAGDCYIEAHKANPFVWEAFESLCKIGADLNVANMFRLPPEYAQPRTAVGNKHVIYLDEDVPADVPFNQQFKVHQHNLDDPFGPSRGSTEAVSDQAILHNAKGKRLPMSSTRHHGAEWETPTTSNGSVDDHMELGSTLNGHDPDAPNVLAAPVRRALPNQALDVADRLRPVGSDATTADERSLNLGGHKRTISGQPSQRNPSTLNDPSVAPRRSNRIYGQATTTRVTRAATEASSFASRVERISRAPKIATGTKNRPGTVVGRVVSGNRKVHPPDPLEKEKERRALSRASDRSVNVPAVTAAVVQTNSIVPTPSAENQAHVEQMAVSALLDNFRQLALGTYSIARFDLVKGIHTFRSLPAHARDNPWVWAQLGKAHYEAADYKTAEECFARVLRLQPSCVEDMEVYSTVLWHLKKEAALACLCHNLKEQDFSAPQTWCAIGNAFSLARDHDQAIASFKRATQLDDNFAYAWTLMGHEYIANEEFETALTTFRKSVSIDRRGYGGWYGLGKSYERMGKLEEAERHYRIAASINPSNATLLVCIGGILERLDNRNAAMALYASALEIAPTSALARFKKARVLMHLRYYTDALRELEQLRDQAPDEANVWFLLGKCHKGLGDKSGALRALTTALNLDVKAAPFIKEAMEALDDDDDDSDLD